MNKHGGGGRRSGIAGAWWSLLRLVVGASLGELWISLRGGRRGRLARLLRRAHARR